MEKATITVHMIVRNEEQWVWYALQSVLPYVDKILIFDTGSTDQTVSILQTIKNDKIVFEEKGAVTPDELVHLRNEQLRQTKTEWFMLLDGDEVWSQDALAEQQSLIHNASLSVMGIVVPTRMCVGDLHHFQDEQAGRYHLLGKTGHFNIRLYRKKAGYRWQGTYPLEAYCDDRDSPIQNDAKNLVMAFKPYWHLSYLKRSSVDTHGKRVLEIGRRDEIKLPEVFFKQRPSIIPSPIVEFSPVEKIIAYLRTPLVYLKRRLRQ